MIEEVNLQCFKAKLKRPGASTIRQRIENLSERLKLEKRKGRKAAAEKYEPIKGHFPGTDRPLAVAQIDHRDAKLIGEIAKSVKETLLFSGSAYFGEIRFIKGEDSDFNFRQRIQLAGSGSRPPE